jgi:hypothetical protein
MDPVSIAPLVVSVWKLISPYAKSLASKLVKKAVESLPDVVDIVWDTVKEKMEEHPETSALPIDLVTTPDDQAVQGAFKYQLKKLLENDEAFALQLEKLVNQAKKQGISYTATLNGDGGIAQGDGSVAVGRGGTYVNGDVSESNIITGNNNSVNGEKKRKK